jgi:hypothetical protein
VLLSDISQCTQSLGGLPLAIRQTPEMVDVAIGCPDKPPSRSRETYAQLCLIPIVRQVLVESAKALPYAFPDKEGESGNLGQVNHARTPVCPDISLGKGKDLAIIPVVPAILCCENYLLGRSPAR